MKMIIKVVLSQTDGDISFVRCMLDYILVSGIQEENYYCNRAQN